ncbi:hypothetical protein KSP39_PZI000192 [Platanthera zijinensis]|uniref:Uncharacterized protein n=1 Tax=Platanthera zijinensis TaxID=2320716 RepID=A0AAP0GFE8_9ASPA
MPREPSSSTERTTSSIEAYRMRTSTRFEGQRASSTSRSSTFSAAPSEGGRGCQNGGDRSVAPDPEGAIS